MDKLNVALVVLAVILSACALSVFIRRLDNDALVRKDLLRALVRHRHEVFNGKAMGGGICFAIHHVRKNRQARARNLLMGLFKKWPKYSGHPYFPVPSPVDVVPPSTAFFEMSDDLWNPETRYGRDRLDLLDFIIRELNRKVG